MLDIPEPSTLLWGPVPEVVCTWTTFAMKDKKWRGCPMSIPKLLCVENG